MVSDMEKRISLGKDGGRQHSASYWVTYYSNLSVKRQSRIAALESALGELVEADRHYDDNLANLILPMNQNAAIDGRQAEQNRINALARAESVLKGE